jgi:predicted phosphodiesterase
VKRIVVISDTQMPYEDKRAVRNIINFIGDYKPDEVIQIGDLVDYPAPSRWTAGTRYEFAGGVIRDSEYAKVNFMAPLRAVYDGPLKILKGNHDERPEKYLEKNAPLWPLTTSTTASKACWTSTASGPNWWSRTTPSPPAGWPSTGTSRPA